ncbi:inositol monophosphatase [Arthrobacter crystallopoietes BAB-32]|uniref:Inositol monophosphatase n=1 Tax=Arthrobacter crystallopoietes BAB-32 TaxID=1246476 RepID=N1V5R2_9MICC|nr:inositol monophosphatase [Arthrobacter crystallopoietes]EMY35432.1 inositol monophosphatase [Arthrobacter crystallopoietes BAB-32]
MTLPETPDHLNDADLAAWLVRSAAQLAGRMRADVKTFEEKTSISDVVTAADHAAEKLVVDTLRRVRPEDSIFGEEGSSYTGTSGRTWVIDPVDGTYNFFTGATYWCAALALKDDGGVRLGAVYHPAEDALWLGGQDLPTTRNGIRSGFALSAPLDQSCAAAYLHHTYLRDEAAAEPYLAAVLGAAAYRTWGSASCELAATSAGIFGVWFQQGLPEWDWLPGKALVEAAGGDTAVVQVKGYRWHVAGGKQQVADAVRLLQSQA